jgi:GxxExxY protein
MIEKHSRDQLNLFSQEILRACIEVHREMGPGLLESIYQACLIKEFQLRKIKAQPAVMLPLIYKGHALNKDFVIDILVENDIVLELKAVEVLLPVHQAQIISYLKLSDKNLGFLINFNVPVLKHGFERFVNNF